MVIFKHRESFSQFSLRIFVPKIWFLIKARPMDEDMINAVGTGWPLQYTPKKSRSLIHPRKTYGEEKSCCGNRIRDNWQKSFQFVFPRGAMNAEFVYLYILRITSKSEPTTPDYAS